MSKEAMKLGEELGRIRSILRVVTGFEDDDQQYVDDASDAIQRLIESLAEQPARPYRLLQDNGSKYFGESWDKAEQPAQQEPVAWMHEWEDGERIPMLTGRDDRNTDEPISVRPLVYADTSPPAQRKPLTDEEIKEVLTKAIRAGQVTWLGYEKDEDGRYTIPSLSINIYQISRAIEAAHGIKENT